MLLKDEEAVIISRIAQAVHKKGGRVFFVGGCVRDKMMGIDSKDIDIEVHGIETSVLEEILDVNGQKIEFGKSFGVYNLKGCSIDIAMPRKESCIGNRHTDFKIDVDPFLGTQKAAKRRDFTVNAIMEDVISGELIDHFGGAEDLRNGIIRHIDDKSFAEDPLRVFRAAQFSARFDFEIADETKKLCRKMEVSALSRERVFEELKKALMKAEKPSVFFRQLYAMGHLEYWFSQVSALAGVEQSPKHHMEGDVFVHTMMVLDEAAKRRDRAKCPLGFMLAALTHDFGKAVATKKTDGEIRSINHEKEGIPLVKDFMHRLTSEKNLIRYVLNMVELHMRPNMLAADKSSVKATNKLFDTSVEAADLIQLAIADSAGKIPAGDFDQAEKFLSQRLTVYNEIMARPHVQGEDLIRLGISPGPEFKELLDYAHKLHLGGVPKEAALKQTMAYRKKI